VKDLESDRHLLAQDTRHALYGPQAERWLESMVRDDVTRVDANLNPRFSDTQSLQTAADKAES
jgi:hypothetical protein